MAPLSILFCYTLILHLFISFFTDFQILTFAPFLIMTCYRAPLQTALWWAFICGLFIDFFSYDTKLGAYALINCLTIFLIYRLQMYFFIDRLSTLPLMTFFFSLVSSCIHLTYFYLNGYQFSLSLSWINIHIIEASLVDALYAGICFTIPSLWSLKPTRRRSPLLNLRR